MQRRDESDKSLGNESTRRPESEIGTRTGRSGSVGNMGGGGSEIDRGESRSRIDNPDRSSGSSGVSDRNRNDSSEGRH